jgi:hypothetical protein
MAEVAVSIPLLDTPNDDEEDRDGNLTLLFRKFFLLSSTMGAIIWMADSNQLPRLVDMALASHQTEDGGRYGCQIAAAASCSSLVVSLSVDPSGTLHQPATVQRLGQLQLETLPNGSTCRRLRHRPLVAFDTEIVCGQNAVTEDQNGRKQYQSHLNFFPEAFGSIAKTAESISLDGCVKIDHLVKLRSRHLLAICKLFTTANTSNNGEPNVLEDMVGQWFGADDEEAVHSKVSLCGILVDVQSRKEIHRICFVDDVGITGMAGNGEDDIFPLHVAASCGTVAAAAWWNGVVLTGVDVRDTSVDLTAERENQNSKSLSGKRKKKKGVKKNSKKDGFARGMSLRG